LRKVRRSESEMENKNILNPDMFKSILPQRVLRELANDNEILERMMSERRSIKTPAFKYFQDIAREKWRSWSSGGRRRRVRLGIIRSGTEPALNSKKREKSWRSQ